jgi:GT2 family glycosyltransferase
MLAVIVVYKMSPLRTPSFLALREAQQTVPAGRLALRILLYDNSCNGEDPGPMPDGVSYTATTQNSGLADAYNQAILYAVEHGYDWLLTLDQDTALPPGFLLRVIEIASKVADDLSIAAITPLIIDGGRTHSPYWFSCGVLPRYYRARDVGVPARDTYAFNSASTFRVTALTAVGGYSPWFWLDYSDGYIFRQLHRHKMRVFVAGDIEVAHHFSLTDLESRVSLTRYRNMRLAESAFWDLEMSALAGLERTWCLAKLAIKHWLFRDSPAHRSVTYEFLKRRLFWTRTKRLAAWRGETLKQFPKLSQNSSPPER